MKKAFVFVMLLGTASMGWAGLYFTVPGHDEGAPHASPYGTPYDVVLINDTPFEGAPILGGVSANIPNAIVAGPASINDSLLPGSWTIEEYGFDPNPVFWWTITNTIPGLGTTGAGELLRIRLHTTGYSPTVVQLWNTNFDEVLAEAVIHQFPEPGTILLLGLGGVLIRKK